MPYLLQKFDSGMHYFLIDEAVAASFLRSRNNRVICTINGTESFHCAILPKKDGVFL